MIEEINQTVPEAYFSINRATKENGFTMPSDILACSFLRTLAASKPSGAFLELGTGTGLSTAWILDGMDTTSRLISLDNDATLLAIAHEHLGEDRRLQLVLSDGEEWINANRARKFDFIFADTWHGKYLLLDEVLDMLNKGGMYVIDDMLPQSNWPDGHQEKATKLVDYLEQRTDLMLTKQRWATGLLLAVKK